MNRVLKDFVVVSDELLRVHKLNLELAETLIAAMYWMKNFADKYQVTIPNEENFKSLMRKATVLMEEIQSSDDFLQHNRNRRNQRGLDRTLFRNLPHSRTQYSLNSN